MSDIPVASGNTLEHDVLPIFRGTTGPTFDPLSFEGTGFLIGRRLLVTCWHCVAQTLPENETYAVLDSSGSMYSPYPLTNIGQVSGAFDLALANVDLDPHVGLRLANQAAAYGTDVWTFGYPFTGVGQRSSGGLRFELQGRYLEGYVTRAFKHQDDVFGETESYELDMPAPAGISGAPLIQRPGRTVLGVIYKSHDVEMVERFASLDPSTGERIPEVQRVVSFGLAHYTPTLRNASSQASASRPLSEIASPS